MPRRRRYGHAAVTPRYLQRHDACLRHYIVRLICYGALRLTRSMRAAGRGTYGAQHAGVMAQSGARRCYRGDARARGERCYARLR